METRSKLWKGFYKKLADGKKKEVISAAMNPSEYRQRARDILNVFKPRSIIEFGPGIGGVCDNLMLHLDLDTYVLVDNGPMLELAMDHVVDDPARFVDAKDVATLTGTKFDLLIAEYCLSETPDEYKDYVLDNIVPNCSNVWIKDVDKDGKIEQKLNKLFSVTISPDVKTVKLFVGKR